MISLKEGVKLLASENRLVRKTFGPREDKVRAVIAQSV
jgi:hypothetical protein